METPYPAPDDLTEVDVAKHRQRIAVVEPVDSDTELFVDLVNGSTVEHSDKLSDGLILGRSALVTVRMSWENQRWVSILSRKYSRRRNVISIRLISIFEWSTA